MSDDYSDFERRLRASMDAQAGRAPSGDGLAELIIAEAVHGATPLRPRRSAKTWIFPLLAAAAVAAVVLSVVGITAWRPDSQPAPPALSQSVRTDSPAPSVSGPAPSTRATTPSATPSRATPDPTRSAPSSPSTSTPAVSDFAQTVLKNFRLLDLTFYNTNKGWALGTADCLSPDKQGQTCPALLRTTDGVHWTGENAVGFDVPGETGICAAMCVAHIRFATDQIGYAYGKNVVLMTRNAGATWQRVGTGGATGLETLNGIVVRIRGGIGSADCAPCTVQTSDVGSTTWTTGRLPAGLTDLRELTFAGDTVLMVASTASYGLNRLLASSDGGHTWASRGEVCPAVNGFIEQLSGAADGTVAIDCIPHEGGLPETTRISTDRGKNFRAGTLPPGIGAEDTDLDALSPTDVLITEGTRLWRSVDGLKHWTLVETSTRPAAPMTYNRDNDIQGFLGSESAGTARWVPADRRTLFTTLNGGATWTSVSWSP